jgi:hypothetical protein
VLLLLLTSLKRQTRRRPYFVTAYFASPSPIAMQS